MDKIKCAICGEEVHYIGNHLKDCHPMMSLAEYQNRFPNDPILSETAKSYLQKKKEEEYAEAKKTLPEGKAYLHEVFGLNEKDGLSGSGKPISITIVKNEYTEMIPKINPDYVFNAKELKWLMSGFEINVPMYVWGHKGAGKTELVEQICARTHRPLVRIQHSLNTEESSILGQWIARDGETIFEYGALPLAMINGWTYLADEYDFALPNVLAIYQSVLEGKALFIKEANREKRVIEPHPDFRFIATGNTNGVGDETGLYQGVTVQNSANFDRFAIVVNKKYLSPDDEEKILLNNTKIKKRDAIRMVDFASAVRSSFDSQNISDTISPRTLVFAARLGVLHGSFITGLRLSFINKLNSVDRQVCEELAQRIFGFENE